MEQHFWLTGALLVGLGNAIALWLRMSSRIETGEMSARYVHACALGAFAVIFVPCMVLWTEQQVLSAGPWISTWPANYRYLAAATVTLDLGALAVWSTFFGGATTIDRIYYYGWHWFSREPYEEGRNVIVAKVLTPAFCLFIIYTIWDVALSGK